MRFGRILLVNPPKVDQGGYKPSPLGLLYLGAYLRKNLKNIEVRIMDGAIEGEWRVVQEIVRFKPDLVGISSLTPGRHQALHIARIAKKLIPRTKTVLGNVHPTLMWSQTMEHYPEVDFIVRGEGEETLCELAEGLPLARIKGLVWRKNGRTIDNPPRPMISNLNILPFPAWDMVDHTKYPPRGEGRANGVDLRHEIRYPIIFSRGCMGSCTFCSSWTIWKGYRFRNGKSVADEVEMMVRKFNAKHFVFQDDTLTGSRRDIMLFCREIIKRKLKIAVYGTTRVDQVDAPMLRLMKKAGFYELAYGIESGSPGMLVRINKKTDLNKIKRAITLTKQAKIKACALMMYGLPQETDSDRRESSRLLKQIKPDETGTVGAVWVFPGTALYYQAKAAKLIDDAIGLGPKPYYIYRGGMGKDPVDRRQQFKDEVQYRFRDTALIHAWEFVASHTKRVFAKRMRI